MQNKFGGNWTKKKLDCLKQYVVAYEKVMKNQPFKLFYIDAFAGSGYRTINKDEQSIGNFLKGSPPLFWKIHKFLINIYLLRKIKKHFRL